MPGRRQERIYGEGGDCAVLLPQICVCVKGEALGLTGHEWCQSQSAGVPVMSPCPRTLRLHPSQHPSLAAGVGGAFSHF